MCSQAGVEGDGVGNSATGGFLPGRSVRVSRSKSGGPCVWGDGDGLVQYYLLAGNVSRLHQPRWAGNFAWPAAYRCWWRQSGCHRIRGGAGAGGPAAVLAGARRGDGELDYWKGPLYRLEAEGSDCVLADARQVKNLRAGRRGIRLIRGGWRRAFERGAVTSCFVATPEFR